MPTTPVKIVPRLSMLDYAIYLLLCICSFGSVWFLRIIISQGIRSAATADVWGD